MNRIRATAAGLQQRKNRSEALVDVDRYLSRIGLDAAPPVSLAGLTLLQQAHMTAVPFENLHVFAGLGVKTTIAWSWQKIVVDGRGGWCFELNGLFDALLKALGFEVRMIGAAVLLGGPNDAINHAALEVTLDRPYLVDVGFGEGPTQPLDLNHSGAQPGGDGDYELMASPKGTTLTKQVDGVPTAQYRFKRVTRELADFEPASELLQRESFFLEAPFATRLVDGGPERVTLTTEQLRFHGAGAESRRAIVPSDWADALVAWFNLTPVSGPANPDGSR